MRIKCTSPALPVKGQIVGSPAFINVMIRARVLCLTHAPRGVTLRTWALWSTPGKIFCADPIHSMKTADPELMRAINRFHVLDAIRRQGSISRTEICEQTDLSSTTVSAITAALLDDGLIATRAVGDMRGMQRGRPRVMLELNADAARVVGVKIGAQRIVYAVTNFQGDVLAELAMPVRVARQPIDVIADLVEDGVRRCVADAGLALGAIKSACVALPGVVEHATGIVRYSPILRERNAAFGPAMLARLDVPTLVESDANAAAIAEHWFRQCRDLDDFLIVTMEQALGLGVMHRGELFRGARGISFNFGDLVVGMPGSAHDCNIRLSDLASESAILAALHDEPGFAEAMRAGAGVSLALQRQEAAEGDVLAESMSRAGKALGIAIANLVTLFAPPRVVLAGSSLAFGDPLLAGLRAALDWALPSWLANISEIVVDHLDDTAWARGAAGAVLRDLYGAPWGTTGPVRQRIAG
jgi:predicted NBD/HSP70 family sugar kinase